MVGLALLASPQWAGAQEVSLRAVPERAASETKAVAEVPAETTEENPGVLATMLDVTHTSVRGYVRNETAYRYVTPSAFSKVLNVMRLETNTPIGDSVEMTLVPRLAYDAAYDLEDVDTIHPRRGPRSRTWGVTRSRRW